MVYCQYDIYDYNKRFYCRWWFYKILYFEQTYHLFFSKNFALRREISINTYILSTVVVSSRQNVPIALNWNDQRLRKLSYFKTTHHKIQHSTMCCKTFAFLILKINLHFVCRWSLSKSTCKVGTGIHPPPLKQHFRIGLKIERSNKRPNICDKWTCIGYYLKSPRKILIDVAFCNIAWHRFRIVSRMSNNNIIIINNIKVAIKGKSLFRRTHFAFSSSRWNER